MSTTNTRHDDGAPVPVPISLGFRLAHTTLKKLEWVGDPGEESCLMCGSGSRLDHVTGCPVAVALEPGRTLDAFDEALMEGVFLAAHQRHTMIGHLRDVIRQFNALQGKVTRVADLLPRD